MSFSSCCSFLNSQIIQRQHNNIHYPDSFCIFHRHVAFLKKILFFIYLFFCFFETGFLCFPWMSWNSLCRLGCPQTHRVPPASTFQMLGLKVCPTMPNDSISSFCKDIHSLSFFFFLPNLCIF